MRPVHRWAWIFAFSLVLILTAFVLVSSLQAARLSLAARGTLLSDAERSTQPQAGEPVDLALSFYALGRPAANQPMVFLASIYNHSEIVAHQVALTVTLPAGLSYRSDTAGVPVTVNGGRLIWRWDQLDPHKEYEVFLFVNVGALPLNMELITTAKVRSENPESFPDDNDVDDYAYVAANTTNLYVNIESAAYDVAPGSVTRHMLKVCNMGFTCSGEVVLNYHLPVSMTLLNWKPETPGWELISQTSQELVLKYPSIGGNGEIPLCVKASVLAQVTPWARDQDKLWTETDIMAPSDTDPLGDMMWLEQNVTGPWSDLSLQKKWLGGILTAGGELHYRIQVRNEGTTGAMNVRITDTLPLNTTFVRATLPENGELFVPVLIHPAEVTWLLPYLAVGDSFEFDVHLAIQGTALPGSVLTNQAAVEPLPDEWLVDNNTASWSETVHPSGVNLRIHKELENITPYQFKYMIFYQNVGNAEARNIVITDTYPSGLTFAYEYTDPYLTIEHHPALSELVLFAPSLTLGPGQNGYVELYFDASQPFGTWYNNRVVIGHDRPEVDPSDNTAQLLTYGGSELKWVDVQVNHPYGVVKGEVKEAAGLNSVYLDTAEGTYFTPFDDEGRWEIWTWQTFQPGDTITITAGNGYAPLVVTIPDPFTVESDAATGLVSGVIADLSYTPLTVWLESGEHRRTALDAGLSYQVGFGPFPAGLGGRVEYARNYDGTPVHILRYFWDDTISLHVNMNADDVAFDYAPYREAHITVKDVNQFIVGEANLLSQFWSGVSGFSGFRTDPYSWVGGTKPDLAPYQTLTVTVNDGNSAQVKLGELNLALDVDNDTVSGTLNAPWLGTQPVDVLCHLFLQSGPLLKTTLVIPNGQDIFTCSWAGAYDITPLNGVFVEYRTPDGHYIGDYIEAPRPAVWVSKYNQGVPGPGGNFIYHIEYGNRGDAPAENVILTDTLDGQLYLDSTGPVIPTGTGSGPIVWNLGTLPPGAKGHFILFTRVLASAGDWITNTIRISTSDPYNASWPWETTSTLDTYVGSANAQLSVTKEAYLWNPTPGQTLGYELKVCNDGDTTSASVTLTDTLPSQVSLVGWWGDHPGWQQVSFNNNVLTLTYPAITGHRCENVGVRVRLNANVTVGTLFTNTVVLGSTTSVADNEDSITLEAAPPLPDLGVDLIRVAGDLTPNGWMHYQVNYGNYGNVDMTAPAQITVTLPMGTQFLEAWRRVPGTDVRIPINPTSQVGREVVFTSLRLDTALNSTFEFRIAITSTATVGSPLDTRVIMQPMPGEGELINNVSKWGEQVYPNGANPRIAKRHTWSQERDRLTYEITFENVGDVDLREMLVITDTLPVGVIPPNTEEVRFAFITELGISVNGDTVLAYVPYLPAGARGTLWFDVTPSVVEPYRWYTNTVTLSTVPEDQRLNDNTATDVAFSGTPFKHINLHWGWLRQVVEGYAAAPSVVLTTPSQVLTQSTHDGYFYFEFNETLYPGNLLSLNIPNGPVPVTIRIPNPYTLQASSATGMVTGQAGTQTAEIWVEIPEHGYRHIWTQPNGAFAVNFGPLPRGARGFVKVESVNNETPIRMHREFMTQDFLIKVNYAHDWVQGVYAWPGVNATVVVNTTTGTYNVTGPVVANEDWDWPHFYSWDYAWTPAIPDIKPGNTVQATTSDGAATQLVVGTINATVDVAQDRLIGTVLIPQTQQVLEQPPVRVECQPWGAPGDVMPIETTVIPNGIATFTCDWSGKWDIQPGQPIAVMYEKNANAVMNVFNEPQQPGAPDVRVTQTATPLPAVVGQDLIFTLTLQNLGDGLATGVRLTNTLPVSMTFVNVTGDIPCSPADRLITCEVGELPVAVQKQVLITVRPQTPGTFLNHVRVSANGDSNPANNVASLTFMVAAANQVRVFQVTPTSAINTQATPITVYGTNFSTPATVQLLGNTGPVNLPNVTVVSAQELKATVPAGLTPGTYHLQVSTGAAGSDTLLNAFTVLSNVAPVVTTIQPNQATNTLPVLVDIYGGNLAPGLTAALRRSGQTDIMLLNIGYVDSAHILATVPAAVPVGSYTLVITNPNGLSAQLTNAYTVLPAMHDLLPRRDSFLLYPPSPRASEAVSLTVTVRRVGGTGTLSNVAVDFYVQDAGGAETYLGRSLVSVLHPDTHIATLPVFWTPLRAGLYTLRAVIDPANAVAETFEDNNVITRSVEVLPQRSRDMTPPTVTGFVINAGEERTTYRQVYLNTTAVDNEGGSGVTHLLYIEYVFNLNTRHWLAVAVSGWVPYAEAGTAYPWQLYPLPGAHYIQVWAADAAGNISTNFGLSFINWVSAETPFALAMDEVHSYLTRLSTGQSLTLRLTSVTGDADIYVWRGTEAGPVLVTASYLEDAVEEVSFVASAAGVYLIEIYGYTNSTYRLDFITNGALRAIQGVIMPTKGRGLPTSNPGITPSGASEAAGVPSAPVAQREHYLFLPITLRSAGR